MYEALEKIIGSCYKNSGVSNLRFASKSQGEVENVRDRVRPKTYAKENQAVNLFRMWHDQWKVNLDVQLKVFNVLEEMLD